MMRAFSLAGCCCCPECPDLDSCTSCGDAEDRAARYEVILEDYPEAVECFGYGPCDLSVVNGTYELIHDRTEHISEPSIGVDVYTCVYAGSFEIGMIEGGCFGGDEEEPHPVWLDLAMSVRYERDRRHCACATSIELEAVLRNDVWPVRWDRKTGARVFDRAVSCEELTGLWMELVGAIGDCFLGPVRATVSKL